MKKNNYAMMASVAVNKSLLKEYQTSYGRTVYLDKDSEFQIKLFNPTSGNIGAEVFINGKSLGDKIIIRPGQLIWLERYLDEARKFKFDTYQVEMSSEEVREAIKNNGDIEVKFYREIVPTYKSFTTWKPIEIPNYYSTKSTGGNTYFGDVVTNNVSQLTTSNCDVNTAYYAERGAATMDSCNCTYNYSENHNIDGTIDTIASINFNKPKKLKRTTTSTQETGRVEKGGYSDQRFTTIDIDLEYFSFKTESIKLLPKSQKPVFKEDLEKIYCPECGRKIKTKFKYCPFCGNKL